MNCIFTEIEGEPRNERGKRRVRCIACGRITKPTASPLDLIHAPCSAFPRKPPRKPGLGDHVHYWLTRWGIYYGPITWLLLRFRKRAVVSSGCTPCDERQEALNKIGWTIGGWAATIKTKVISFFRT